MRAAVPSIEVAHDADAARAGRPDREVDAGDAFESDDMRAEFIVSVVVAPLPHKVEIEFGENAGERVGIVELERLAVVRAALNHIAGRGGRILLHGGPGSFEETFGAKFNGVA